MKDIEGRLTDFFRSEAAQISAPPQMYEGTARRARIRRVVTATVAGLAVVAVVMGGVVTAASLRGPSTTPPAGTRTPQDQGAGLESVVGQGTVSGLTWKLVTYESGNGLCVDLQIGSGSSGGGCGFDVPARHDLSVGVGRQRGLSKTIIDGVISKRVAKLVVILDGSKEIEVPIIDGPENLDVDFFVDFLPPTAEGVVEARDAEGRVLQKERLRSVSGFGGDDAEDATGAPFFYPSWTQEEGMTVMPVTFVDGSSAEIVAQSDLGVAEMGAQVFTSGGLGAIDRTVDFRYGDGSSFMHDGPLTTYQGGDGGQVELWEPVPEMSEGECPYLVYLFGSWFVGVRTCQLDLSEAEKQAWARSLVGQVNRDGFLVLEARPPLVLQRTGGHEGPQLILGMNRDGEWIDLKPGRCREERGGGVRTMSDGTRVEFSRLGDVENTNKPNWFASWCEDGLVRIQVEYASEEFVMAAAEGFRLRNIVLAD